MACPGINIRLAPQNNLRSQGGIGATHYNLFGATLGLSWGGS